MHDITAPAEPGEGGSTALTARPVWITDELIALTLKIWQPFYAVCLTVQDAADIILNASRLMSSLTPRSGERLNV